MRASTEVALNAIDISAGGNSNPIYIAQAFAVSVQCVGTGSPNAEVKIQVSNDHQQPVNGGSAPTNWSDLTGASVTVDSAAVFLIPRTEICYNWLRIVSAAGGTGTVTARVTTQAM